MSDGEAEGTEAAKQLQQAAPDAEFPETKAAAKPAAPSDHKAA
jgi:hypothetical protein